MSVALKKLSWDDIKDFPESAGRTEIVDGELVMSPTPAPQHQWICTRLGGEIWPLVRDGNLGKLFSSAIHVVLAAHANYEPDLCFISKDRLHIIQGAVVEGPPDLIIEVISEANRSHDTVVKFRDYERYGVREYWLVDQREEHIRVYYLEGGKYTLLGTFGRGDKVVSLVLPGLDLDPARIF